MLVLAQILTDPSSCAGPKAVAAVWDQASSDNWAKSY